MKWIDLPPIWLAAHGVIVYLVRGFAEPLFVGQYIVGLGIIAIGVAFMILAVAVMTKHKTTVIPHQQPDALVTSGVFRISRNPIYLGDALVLAGAIIWLSAPTVALILIPIFMAIITIRFIKLEEARLHKGFGPAFAAYAKQTRRWV